MTKNTWKEMIEWNKLYKMNFVPIFRNFLFCVLDVIPPSASPAVISIKKNLFCRSFFVFANISFPIVFNRRQKLFLKSLHTKGFFFDQAVRQGISIFHIIITGSLNVAVCRVHQMRLCYFCLLFIWRCFSFFFFPPRKAGWKISINIVRSRVWKCDLYRLIEIAV